MKKQLRRSISFVIVLALCLSLMTAGVMASGAGMANFTDKKTYTEGYFKDIGGKWFEGSVARGYSLGLIDGKGEGLYDYKGNVTLAEAIKLAACLHSIYYTGETAFVQGAPWYQVYVDYCLSKGILSSGYPDYRAAATRAQFASILAGALPPEALPAINTVEDNAIPDVKTSASYAPAVYKLYRAGILTGSDNKGSFLPSSNIQRSEMAAIVTRMADPSLRKSVTLGSQGPMTAEQISAKCSSAVFYIEIYDKYGNATCSGSGVFISADGRALTNHHVVEDAYSASIMTSDGKVYNVKGYYDAKASIDLALIQVEGSGFNYLEPADVSGIAAGQTVFAVGSPLGLDNTISQGIISNPSRLVDGLAYIQTTAPISHGSSGGALINDRGKLLGITSATFTDGQNLNLAVPISRASELNGSTLHSFPLEDSAADYGASLSFNSSVTVAAGGSGSVLITALEGSYSGDVYIHFDIADEGIASASWGEWDGDDIRLFVYGIKAGTTTATISLCRSDNDKVLATGTLKVTVTGTAPAVSYYSGYYPAPDFGSVVGCPQYYYDGEAYYYRYMDFNSDTALDKYDTSLYANGFEFWKEDTDSYGDPLVYYHNSAKDLYIVMGIDYVDGYTCLYVMPYFGYEV